jgi:hypothetical protein
MIRFQNSDLESTFEICDSISSINTSGSCGMSTPEASSSRAPGAGMAEVSFHEKCYCNQLKYAAPGHKTRRITPPRSSNQRSSNPPHRWRSSSFLPSLFPPRIRRSHHHRLSQTRSNNLCATRNKRTSDNMDQAEIHRCQRR